MARRKKTAAAPSADRGEGHNRERVPTGVAGLDTVLDGGLLPGQMYVLTGEPGTGKTVLAAELAFRHAARGGTAVIVSFLSEPHAVLVANLSSFTFFDRALIASRRVTLLSASRPIVDEGLDGLLDFLRSAVTQSRANLLVIEGLGAIDIVADTPLASKRFLGDLASLGVMMGCIVVCTVVRDEQGQSRPEQVMADGVFELGRERSGSRRVRTFQVLKLRGGRHLEGLHSATIDPDGFCVWPRLEARARVHKDVAARDRLGLGIPRLDEMLEGGVVGSSSTGILGASGAGKTLLGLHFLGEGCARDEPSLLFGFYESPARLMAKARGVGLRLDRFARKGGPLEIVWQPALEQPLDLLAERLLTAVQRRGVRRLFVDGIDAFEVCAPSRERLMRFLAALTADLRALEVTTLFSEETPLFDDPHTTLHALSTIYDDIVLLRYVELRGELHRLISILKMRESGYDSSVREFSISSAGIELAPTPESAADVLSGRERAVHPELTTIAPEDERIRAPLRRTRRRS